MVTRIRKPVCFLVTLPVHGFSSLRPFLRQDSAAHYETITFDFGNGINKVHAYDNSKVTDSISFSGSSFSEESLNLVLSIKISNDGLIDEFNLSIDINKPPAEDMFYLWGGMTVFWASIGAYVLYISSRLTQLRDK